MINNMIIGISSFLSEGINDLYRELDISGYRTVNTAEKTVATMIYSAYFDRHNQNYYGGINRRKAIFKNFMAEIGSKVFSKCWNDGITSFVNVITDRGTYIGNDQIFLKTPSIIDLYVYRNLFFDFNIKQDSGFEDAMEKYIESDVSPDVFICIRYFLREDNNKTIKVNKYYTNFLDIVSNNRRMKPIYDLLYKYGKPCLFYDIYEEIDEENTVFSSLNTKEILNFIRILKNIRISQGQDFLKKLHLKSVKQKKRYGETPVKYIVDQLELQKLGYIKKSVF